MIADKAGTAPVFPVFELRALKRRVRVAKKYLTSLFGLVEGEEFERIARFSYHLLVKSNRRNMKKKEKAELAAQVLNLLYESRRFHIPPPSNLVKLCHLSLGSPGKTELTSEQKRGVEAELKLSKEGFASPQAIANAAGVSRQSIDNWRKLPEYISAYNEGVANQISNRLDRRAEQDMPVQLNRNNLIANFAVDVRNNWEGPIRSPINGQTYDTPNDYIDHILLVGILPSPGDVKQKD